MESNIISLAPVGEPSTVRVILWLRCLRTPDIAACLTRNMLWSWFIASEVRMARLPGPGCWYRLPCSANAISASYR